MKILFIHEVNWAQKVKFEIHELPEILSKSGHEVHFIDFAENRPQSQSRRVFDLRTSVIEHLSHTVEGSKVRLITPGRIFPSPFDRLLASVTFVPLLTRLILCERYDLIILYAVPTYGWQTIVLSRLFRTPVIYRGLDVSHALRESRFRRLILAAERYIYRRCHWLSLNNSALRDYVISQGASPLRTSVDYPGLDIEKFDVQASKSRLDAHGVGNLTDRNVIFLGTLFRFSGLDRVISEVGKYQHRELGFKITIVGDGELEEVLAQQVHQLGLEDRVTLVGRVRYEEVPFWIAHADVAIVPFEPELVTHNALPWKIVQYLASGVAVVSTRLRGTEAAFPEGTGVTYVGCPEEIVPRVRHLLLNKEELENLVHDGQRHVRSRFNWKSNVQRFEELFESVVEKANVK